jgi:hypothetical protein
MTREQRRDLSACLFLSMMDELCRTPATVSVPGLSVYGKREQIGHAEAHGGVF